MNVNEPKKNGFPGIYLQIVLREYTLSERTCELGEKWPWKWENRTQARREMKGVTKRVLKGKPPGWRQITSHRGSQSRLSGPGSSRRELAQRRTWSSEYTRRSNPGVKGLEWICNENLENQAMPDQHNRRTIINHGGQWERGNGEKSCRQNFKEFFQNFKGSRERQDLEEMGQESLGFVSCVLLCLKNTKFWFLCTRSIHWWLTLAFQERWVTGEMASLRDKKR